MSEAAAKAFELFRADIGNDEGTGDWFQVTQEQIDQFADVTHDHQFIHVDPERAKETPFGTTIAHGFLTLSMLTHLLGSVPQDMSRLAGVVMGVNYGFEKVRFINPVKVDFAKKVERTVVDVLAELKPGRNLYANVEFYAGVVMDHCGLPRDLFTPTFASSRVIGWCANILEQAAHNRIVRPLARYVGPPPPQPVPELH